MDDTINELTNELENLKENYPNLSCIWKTYIKKRYSKLLEDIEECNNVINILKNGNTNDLNIMQMILLMYIRQEQNVIT